MTGTTPPPVSGNIAKPLQADDPRQLGAYQVVGRLGQGGMGWVFLGRAPDGTAVAIKVIRPELASRPEFRARFAREAESARRVRRFTTAAVLDADPDGPQPYLVTEFVEGPTLSKHVAARGPLRPADLEQLAISVATALSAIHAAGIVHRDLTPANVLLSPVGPKVIDFGLAREFETASELSRNVKQAIGTPGYMSPEQILDAPITPAVDIFAWGAIMVFAATGKPPFGHGRMEAVLYRIVNEPPQTAGVPEELRELVELAMRKDPAQRPTAEELRTALIAGTPVPARPAEPAAGATATVEGAAAAAAGDKASRSRRRGLFGRRGRTGGGTSQDESTQVDAATRGGSPAPRSPALGAPGPGSPTSASPTPASQVPTSPVPAPQVPGSPVPGPPAPISPPPGASARGAAGLAGAAGGAAGGAERQAAPTPRAAGAGPVLRTPPPASAAPAGSPAPVRPGPASPPPAGPSGPAHPSGPGGLAPTPGLVGPDGIPRSPVPMAGPAGPAAPVRPPSDSGLLDVLSPAGGQTGASVGSGSAGGESGGRGRLRPAVFVAGFAVLLAAAVAVPLVVLGGDDGDSATSRRADVSTSLAAAAVTREDRKEAARLSLVAYRIAPTPAAEVAMIAAFAPDLAVRLPAASAPSADAPSADTPYTEIALSPNGELLAGTDDNGVGRLWHLEPGHEPRLVAGTPPEDHFGGVDFGADGSRLAVGGEQHAGWLLDVSDPATSGELGRTDSSSSPVRRVALSDDGSLLVTAASGSIALWGLSPDAPGRPELLRLERVPVVSDIALSPDGKILATAGIGGSMQLWDLADPRQPRQLIRNTGYLGAVNSVAFSPDGLQLVTGGDDRMVRVWDLSDPARPAMLHELPGHAQPVTAVAFGTAGQPVSGDAEGVVAYWDTTAVPPTMVRVSDLDSRIRDIATDLPRDTLAFSTDSGEVVLWTTNAERLAEFACTRPEYRMDEAEWERQVPDLDYEDPCAG